MRRRKITSTSTRRRPRSRRRARRRRRRINTMTREPTIYGLLAEFDGPEELVVAAAKVRAARYRRVDAYTPFPVHHLAEALGLRRTRVPMIVLIGGILGGLGGVFMQWYADTQAYPVNGGGRPYNTPPAVFPLPLR